MKCLTLALSDGKSCYPIDFSLHREKGKKKDYGLTLKQRKEQFKEKRNAKNPDYARKAECDESKLEMARRMLCHAVGHGINFKYVLARNAKTLGHRGHIQGMPRLSWTGKMSDSDDYAMPDLD